MIMKDQEINIAIAEACGWKWNYETAGWHGPDGRFETKFDRKLPDYCHDLNAMHEAETVLYRDQPHSWQEYTDQLRIVCEYPIHRATAHQRAVAFLRCKGLWKEESHGL